MKRKKIKILVVDDEVELTKIFKSAFEKTGEFEVRTENDGIYVYKAALAFAPDLILLDVMMKQMHGPEAVNELKNDPATKDIPILFLTGILPWDEKSKIMTLNGIPYISKPIAIEDVIKRVEEMLQLRG